MAGGRPSKLTRTLLDKLEAVADDQWSIKAAATSLGVSETTWRRWEADPSDEALLVEFRTLAARVRNGAGAKIDDLAWGALRSVLEDPMSRPGDKITAATNALRLRTPHKVELSGKDGDPIRLAHLSEGAQDAARRFLRDAGSD